MIDPDQLENEADTERERADSHTEAEELLRRQAEEQREAKDREDETHE